MAKRGRPFKEDARKNQYRVRLNDDERNRLERLTKMTGMGQCDVFRTALENYEKQQGN